VSNNTEVFPGTTDRIILLSGSLNSVLTAARMVVAELFKETPKENPEPSFAEVLAITKLSEHSDNIFSRIMSVGNSLDECN
jgi:hypothetical protein